MDEILITEPRRPKERCSLLFLMDIFSLMDLKVDIAYRMEFEMRVENTGGDESLITEPRRPKEKCFLQKITSSFPHGHSFPHDFQIYGGCLG